MDTEPPAFIAEKPRRVAFLARFGIAFALLYVLLYGLPFPLGPIPAQSDKWPVKDAARAVAEWREQDPERLPIAVSYPDKWFDEVADEVRDYTVWFGENVLGSIFDIGEVAPVQSGSGDTLFDWVRALALLTLALLLAPLAALGLRRQRVLNCSYAVVRVYVRYALASTMCVYGFVKLLPLQFPALSGERLYGTYGDASPMNVLWSFMGAPEPYTILTGAAEVLGGMLLLFRRTTTLGALVTALVMTNVMLLNFCYDVPVKLFSAHMVLFAGFVLAGDARRLWSVFWSHEAIPPRQLRMRVPVWVLAPWFALKFTAIACVIGVPLVTSYVRWQEQQSREPGPLEGIWEVREFTSTAPAREQWHHLSITYMVWDGQTYSSATIRELSGQPIYAQIATDPETATLSLLRGNAAPIELSYEERSQLVEGSESPIRQLVLTGSVDGRDLRAVLDRRDESTFRLNRTGFHWIQERPVNQNRK